MPRRKKNVTDIVKPEEIKVKRPVGRPRKQPKNTHTVFIVEDQLMIRAGLKKALEDTGKFEVIGDANLSECYVYLQHFQLKPEIILFDMNRADRRAISRIETMRKHRRTAKMIMLADSRDLNDLCSVMKVGVDGYISKRSSVEELTDVILKICNDEVYVQPLLVPFINQRMLCADIDREKVHMVSKREIQVLRLVAGGFSNYDIAQRLDISERTVKNHLASIFKKIGVDNRSQASLFMMRNNLL